MSCHLFKKVLNYFYITLTTIKINQLLVNYSDYIRVEYSTKMHLFFLKKRNQ